MSKITTKLQVTIPKALAEQYGLSPGDEIDWQAAGEVIRVIPRGRQAEPLTLEEKLHLFDAMQDRQRRREEGKTYERRPGDRGWTRDELYEERLSARQGEE